MVPLLKQWKLFCVSLLCWLRVVVTSDWDSNDEHYTWWSSGPSICYLPQWAGYEPVHENCTWALSQGNPSLLRAILLSNEITSRGGRYILCWVYVCILHRNAHSSFLKYLYIYTVHNIFSIDACSWWNGQSVWDWSPVQEWRHRYDS